ncbi:MAG TPA: carbamoyl phosphate synthase small subunit [Lachnospiraceae bacterium]|nr:carbamoyl phosphate synthase small subunit [Lachnospiraceae bacterium]
MSKPAYLVLENGQIFKGKAFGAEKETIAEVVFTTGMTGYLETLTDQSYFGQAVVQTFPLIGNYGIISPDSESASLSIGPKAYIVKHLCVHPSNFRSEENMDAFFRKKGITGVYGIDTRALTRAIRSQGVMNGLITYDLAQQIDYEKIKNYTIENAVESVTISKPRVVEANSEHETIPTGIEKLKSPVRRKVALLDLGLKENIVRELSERNCEVTIFPSFTSADRILEYEPDGIMLSNGPGDPTKNVDVIETVRTLCMSGVPIFGICLGHQIMALANGCLIRKMKYGHRGANQPVKNLETGRVSITTQNHGYVVKTGTIDEKIAREWYINANDGSCEGIRYLDFPAVTVQFHPEACAGPQDTSYLFDNFMEMMGKEK